MGAPQYEQAGADIGGTGTTNTIPRWTGASTLGDSVITQSGAAGSENVLISRAANASTSLLALTTSGGPAVDTLFLRGGTALNYFDFVRNVTTGALQIQGNQAGANNIALAPTSGNVGIGTASPGNLLTLSRGNGSGFNLQYDAAGNARTGLFLATRGSSSAIIGGGSEWADATTTARSTAATAILQNAGVIQFFTDTGLTSGNTFTPTERARLDLAGRWLLGTSTAASITSVRSIIASASDTYLQFADTALSRGGLVGTLSGGIGLFTYTGAIGSETYALRALAGSSSLDISQTSGYGLKLPATPGNTDPNTLDAYVDGGTAGSGGKTWTITDNSGAGLALTITSCEYIQVGKAITICVDVTFPVTASAANANLSLPVAAKGNWHAGTVAFQSAGAGGLAELTVMCNGAEIAFYAGTTSTRQTNVNLSNKRLIFSITYFTAQ